MTNHIWKVPKRLNIDLLSKLTLSNNIKEVLLRRGFKEIEDITYYLQPTHLPESSVHFPQLDKATYKIINSLKMNKPIAICGDYDADGMTSTALLVDVLTKLNGKPIPFIPSRTEEGYGLNKSLVEKVSSSGIKLIITVDNGVSAIDAINYAKELEIDVIITDHHKINNRIDNVFALIHPETTPINSPYRDIAGVGVTYILAENIANKLNNKGVLNISKDLLCIGTIADMSSLTGANRYWLKKWIKNLHNTECLGLKGLMKTAKINNKSITSKDIGFKIAPRINSIGRIDDPKLIIDLLLEKDQLKLDEKLHKCEEINKRRKFICTSVEQEALKIISSNKKVENSFILIAQGHWNNGVIGLVASRIMEKYSRPTAVLTSEGQGMLRGSARSPSTFNIINALSECSDLLVKFGGHSAAAGFTIKANNLMKLEQKLQLISSEWLSENINLPSICPESYICFNQIDSNLLDDISQLEPFGINNRSPIFWSRGCRVSKSSYGFFGQFICHLSQGDNVIDAVQWKPSSRKNYEDELIDVVFNIDIKETRRERKPILNLLDISKYSEEVEFKYSKRIYKCMQLGEKTISIKNEKNETLTFEINNLKDYIKYTKENNAYINGLIDTSISLLGFNVYY